MKKPFTTVGVRFPANPAKVYTYKIDRKFKVHLGQELVADDTPLGSAIVYVVRIDKAPKTDGPWQYKFISRKVANL